MRARCASLSAWRRVVRTPCSVTSPTIAATSVSSTAPRQPVLGYDGCADERDRQHERRRQRGDDEQHASPAADERDPHDRQDEQRCVARLAAALGLTEKRDERVTAERQEEQRVKGSRPRQPKPPRRARGGHDRELA